MKTVVAQRSQLGTRLILVLIWGATGCSNNGNFLGITTVNPNVSGTPVPAGTVVVSPAERERPTIDVSGVNFTAACHDREVPGRDPHSTLVECEVKTNSEKQHSLGFSKVKLKSAKEKIYEAKRVIGARHPTAADRYLMHAEQDIGFNFAVPDDELSELKAEPAVLELTDAVLDEVSIEFPVAFMPMVQNGPARLVPLDPFVTSTTAKGFVTSISGTCDASATGHAASTSAATGQVTGTTCVDGVLTISLNLRHVAPDAAAAFTVTVSSSNEHGSTISEEFTIARTMSRCPAGYVGVPASGIPQLGNASASSGNVHWWLDTSQEFCVMKYAASKKQTLLPQQGGGADLTVESAVSVAEIEPPQDPAQSPRTGLPWVHICRGNIDETGNLTGCLTASSSVQTTSALQACANASHSNGTETRLISNTQWQTVARNIENVPTNWSGAAVGTGVLPRGHSDKNYSPPSPNSIIPPKGDDGDPYYLTDNDGTQALGDGWEQKRTHTISTGAVVWDFAGNVRQWVSDDGHTLGLNPSIPARGEGGHEHYYFDEQSFFPVAGINRLIFAPLGAYTGRIDTTGNFIGEVIYGGTAGAVARAGSYMDHWHAGIFAVLLNFSPTTADPETGFRCSAKPF